MTRSTVVAFLGAMSFAAFAAAAATRPAALASAAPGLWEITGLPGAKVPARECVGDVAALAQLEHRGRSCTRSVLTGDAISTVIEYSCAGRGFGRTKMTMLTPRSIRIETQGISDQLPFNYVLQARRVGDCPPRSTASAH
ncbi:MAG: DUF3617 domain-containing protein [Sphingomicrobium sp.]